MTRPADPFIPDPCVRCGAAEPLTDSPRDELYFYTGAVSVTACRAVIDVEREPRGRLCAECTCAFLEFTKNTKKDRP